MWTGRHTVGQREKEMNDRDMSLLLWHWANANFSVIFIIKWTHFSKHGVEGINILTVAIWNLVISPQRSGLVDLESDTFVPWLVAFTCDSIYLYSKLQLECLFLAHGYHGHLNQVLSSTNDTMITMAYPGRIIFKFLISIRSCWLH